MKGICCICRKSIGTGRPKAKQVVASFTLSHYGLCPTCLGRTRADIARIYGQGVAAQGAGVGNQSAVEKGLGA
jgi:hypothetical protein